jgi:hypothetical protein
MRKAMQLEQAKDEELEAKLVGTQKREKDYRAQMKLYDCKIEGIFPDQNDLFVRHEQLNILEFLSLYGTMLSVKQSFAGFTAFTSTLPECSSSSTHSGQLYWQATCNVVWPHESRAFKSMFSVSISTLMTSQLLFFAAECRGVY